MSFETRAMIAMPQAAVWNSAMQRWEETTHTPLEINSHHETKFELPGTFHQLLGDHALVSILLTDVTYLKRIGARVETDKPVPPIDLSLFLRENAQQTEVSLAGSTDTRRASLRQKLLAKAIAPLLQPLAGKGLETFAGMMERSEMEKLPEAS